MAEAEAINKLIGGIPVVPGEEVTFPIVTGLSCHFYSDYFSVILNLLLL